MVSSTDYVETLLSGSVSAAWDLVERARRAGWLLERVYRELLIAGQREIGDRWARAQISVAQEHLCSAITQTLLGQLAEHLPAPTGARVLVAAPAGEHHVLPAHFAADLLQLRGWDARLLGANVDDAVLFAAVERDRPTAVGLSATLVPSLARARHLARTLRERYPALQIVIGGGALDRIGERHARDEGWLGAVRVTD